MAATFQPITCSAAPLNPRKPDPSGKSPSSNWWTPLFGWSSDPDYISTAGNVKMESDPLDNGSGPMRSEKNLFRGSFTEEKAKELRKKMRETSTFHDAMYHSAIASRLALDVSDHRQI